MVHFFEQGRSDFLTDHCRQRMNQRGVSRSVLEDVMQYGREQFSRGAVVYFVGAREVARYAELGIDLNHCMNVHVVCASKSSTVLTTYVNQRMSRPRGQRYDHRRTHRIAEASRPPMSLGIPQSPLQSTPRPAPQSRYLGWSLPTDTTERQAS